jgi:hypothetical protein
MCLWYLLVLSILSHLLSFILSLVWFSYEGKQISFCGFWLPFLALLLPLWQKLRRKQGVDNNVCQQSNPITFATITTLYPSIHLSPTHL